MWRRALPALVLVGLASCGARNQEQNASEGATAVDHATLASIALKSDAFADGQAIPLRYTCEGTNQPPGLSWGEPPPGTKSFAVIVDDPDAPGGTFRHWGVFGIPAAARSIGGSQGAGTEITNDFGKPGYGGPCPPKGHGPHHYRFKLFALDADRLDIGANGKIADLEREARKHALGQGELIGTYERR
jgi:Raf kinase inhibitor-like YbhB/YbcL family protein